MLEITYKKTEELLPYARNARTHSIDQVKQIAASITEFGFTNPILIDEEGRIIAGHGRVMAAKTLGLEDVPTITIAGLSDAQRRAYILADNKLALNAGWDMEMLRMELGELDADGFDLELTGFSQDEISQIQPNAPIDLDVVDEIKEECEIKIICADWNEREIAIAKLGSKKISWLTLEGMLR